ncbi:LysR family transcriptional regulator [Paenibacillus abyssi]|uniref:LysR family transcriptional regulator n=1 Tax=Paenibacillus abyssi TaxID=1340531 RepID=A0A917FYZ0_9BACL|nr:LysR family transcriptional regulator [Paenibacillus abyssi]GGG14700.1 LysR family transcriptional regulator [Paenibacillus abyssi]
MMNMEWYRIFLHTAKLGNLTKAAHELHITQPSVSYAIKQLEAELGVKLFDRMSKGVALTTEGSALLEYVEKSFSFIDAGENKIRSLRELTAGELRIGANGPVIKHLLLPVLDQFHAEHPDVRIRLTQGKTSDIRNRLKEGRIDLGLVHLPLLDDDLNVDHLLAIQDCFVVGQAYRSLTKQSISTEDMIKIPLLLLSQESSTRAFVEQWLSSQGLHSEVDIELSSLDMLTEFAQRGYGAAFVTHSFVQDLLEQGKLFALQTREPIPTRSVGIATRRVGSLTLIANRFKEMLTADLNTNL